MDNENILIHEEDREFKKRNQLLEIWRRLRKNKVAMLGLIILTIFALSAIFADVFLDYQKSVVDQNVRIRLQGPSADHWFGTDNFGRDVFARIVYGARISLSIGLIAVAFSATCGGLLGGLAGLYGGMVDNIIMRILDTIVCIPGILLTLAMVAALGPGINNLLIAITISSIPAFTRVVRAAILSIVGQEFIESARSYGTSDFRLIYRHILPNAIGPIIVQATMSVAGTILQISGLSFLGMGVEAPTPEWGAMLSEARNVMRTVPYLVMFPGLAIVLSALSLNLLGDGLRDALDPKLRD